jgi:hypothetical protein
MGVLCAWVGSRWPVALQAVHLAGTLGKRGAWRQGVAHGVGAGLAQCFAGQIGKFRRQNRPLAQWILAQAATKLVVNTPRQTAASIRKAPEISRGSRVSRRVARVRICSSFSTILASMGEDTAS